MRDADRQPEHRRNRRLDAWVADLNADLEQGAAAGRRPGASPRHPTVFLVGCPRSGTTLLYQWLAGTGRFTYPSNLVSRFPSAPWVGARVQELLADPGLDFRGELNPDRDLCPADYRSRLGKTKGLLAPNEFWYWWRRFLPQGPTHRLSAAQLRGIDSETFRAELAAWESVLDRPVLLKALILNWNLPWLAGAVPGSVFLHIKRDPISTMRSLLAARRDFFGETGSWYSFRPPEYPELAGRSPAAQVAGQVHYTLRGVEEGLAAVGPGRHLTIEYEELCRAPAAVYDRLQDLLSARGYDLPGPYQGPPAFDCRSKIQLDSDQEAELRRAWQEISSGRRRARQA